MGFQAKTRSFRQEELSMCQGGQERSTFVAFRDDDASSKASRRLNRTANAVAQAASCHKLLQNASIMSPRMPQTWRMSEGG
jgi:hypothetical protein